MPTFATIARDLADVLVQGPWRADDVVELGRRALGRRPRWLRPLVGRLMARFPDSRPTLARAAECLAGDEAFRRLWAREPFALGCRPRPSPVMAPASGPPSGWPVPAITTTIELARRLELEPGELDWFADPKGIERMTPEGPLRHYHYRWRAKRNGSTRLIEAPRPRLKAIQRRLLDEILAPIPPHDAAHGFRPGRSVRTFVEGHAGRDVVLKMDLRDFFASIVGARVVALFRTAGYPEAVARLLAGLCTNRVPSSLWRRADAPEPGPDAWRTRQLYRGTHLPQGAPTSPALANLCAYRLDCRLAGLASSAGATYTRYSDDLAFSGDGPFARSADRFLAVAGSIAIEEGFAVQHRKTRVMRRGGRQSLAAAVLNDRPNIARDDLDALKAILHNCRKHGPAGQNRQGHADFHAHLAGRIAHVATFNPERARRLRAVFDQIAW
jgi:hypothetical protein